MADKEFEISIENFQPIFDRAMASCLKDLAKFLLEAAERHEKEKKDTVKSSLNVKPSTE